MVKCPFCQYDNEEGVLFCEQCKSDLTGVEPAAPSDGPPPMATPVFPPPPSEVPLAAVLEDTAHFGATMPIAEPIIMAPPPIPDPDAPVATPVAEMMPPTPAEAISMPPASGEPMIPPISAPLVDTAPHDPPTDTPAPAAPESSAAVPSAPAAGFPVGAQPKLVVLRGVKIGLEYPIYEGHNFVGRTDEKPVDIDLEDQEPADQVWVSRQHALITFENGEMMIEDLGSSNGTFVNRTKVHSGQKRAVQPNDIIQIGKVQMKVRI